MSRIGKRIILAVVLIPVVLVMGIAWVLWGGVSNPAGRETIGEIRPPLGFERVTVEPDSFGSFIRAFPLQDRGAYMRYSNGKLAYGQYFGYAVLDLPMLGSTEQCADAVVRMRAEYLWSRRRYSSIHFHSVSGTDQRYGGGADRKAFENYLREVFDHSNTTSLRRELNRASFRDVKPGDVFVREASRPGYYGHAVLVVDVAVNPRTCRKALMLAQSSVPALTMHVIRDMLHPFRSPWIVLDDTDEYVFISGISFRMTDLRSW